MRRSIALIASTGLALTLAACSDNNSSGKETTSAPATETSTEAPAGGGKLVIWTDANREPAFKIAADNYKADTGNEVELVVKENDQMRSEFSSQAAAGEGPDVVFGAHDWLGEFVTNGLVAPVELGDKAGDFNELAVNAFTYEGTTYGVPYAVENLAIFRNADLVDSTPATFDEMIAKGKEAGVEYPFIMQVGADGDPYTMYPFEASFSGPVFTLDGDKNYTADLNLGGDKGKAFAKWLSDNGEKGTGVLDTNISYDIAVDAFKSGKSPYILGGPWMIADFAGMNIAVDPIPAAGDMPASPFLGVQGGFINAGSANQLLATDFLVNYVGSKEVQDKLFEIGQRLPALTASANDATSDPLMAGFAAAGKEALPMPSLPEMGAVWGFWGKTESQIIAGDADPAGVWDKMITDIETEMNK
ncbi:MULTISPECIES: sugar ABC transporter substrate-binding protein [Trueperella]|uniref:Maltose ABC transporter substrate-binding protein n=1 Tax=Trueperella bernardiae TaxID=59561 RepID=A0A0W1KL80_9ACTO|nr:MULTISPECIES: maltose ABC transporter substrate-binding protein [Trueperella]KTF04383.1 Maltose-binding periplasmic protein precursor [Trueperella bernardiae]MCM3906825.1 maltose ABC transporter substrate-binding protein [Trueperella bernardiae]MDK8601348.1 maltose ABC transporter substrate-binding protein [Trueperella bernardiae]MDV6239584.1 maltose ABC transporter substrate-binding protein [Trueperella bernardiae]OCW60791.1 ABC transporter substrate-binding protein [Trueperella bernardiae